MAAGGIRRQGTPTALFATVTHAPAPCTSAVASPSWRPCAARCRRLRSRRTGAHPSRSSRWQCTRPPKRWNERRWNTFLSGPPCPVTPGAWRATALFLRTVSQTPSMSRSQCRHRPPSAPHDPGSCAPASGRPAPLSGNRAWCERHDRNPRACHRSRGCARKPAADVEPVPRGALQAFARPAHRRCRVAVGARLLSRPPPDLDDACEGKPASCAGRRSAPNIRAGAGNAG